MFRSPSLLRLLTPLVLSVPLFSTALAAPPSPSAQVVPSAVAPASPTVVLCGRLIDGRSSRPRGPTAVVVEGERIVKLVPPARAPRAVSVIDLRTKTCLPGLIDAHTHPLIKSDAYQIEHLQDSSAYKALRGLKAAQRMLRAGWTTIRIAGDADVFYAHLDVRHAIDEGMFEGPRITGAGHYLSITGGGGDINHLGPEHHVVADGLVVDGPDEVRKAVREEVKHGSDWIKVLVTGAFMTAGDNPQNVHMSPAELAAAVETARLLDVPVMAHAHSAEGIKRAIRAGVRSIEHGTFVDDEGIRMLKRSGVYLVPTLYIGEHYLEVYKDSPEMAKMNALTRKYRKQYMAGMRKAVRAGVKIGVGSDFGGHEDTTIHARELRVLTEVGMSPMQAIQAATKVNAEMLGWSDRIGTLEPGKFADLIAVDGNPLANISELEQVTFVMKGGHVVVGPAPGPKAGR